MPKHKLSKNVYVEKILRQVVMSQTDLAVLMYMTTTMMMMVTIAARPDVRSSDSARAKICCNYIFYSVV